MTKVVFRKYPDGELIALFPELPATPDPSFCLCYSHIGQHSAATPDLVHITKRATENEAAPLKTELERIGYTLCVMQRFPARSYQTRKKALQYSTRPS